MFLFKEGSARELLSQLYVIFIRIQGSISFVVDKENAILTLFSSINEVKERDFKIDSLKWLKDESLDDADELPEPEELAADAISELESAVEELSAIIGMLENNNESSTSSVNKTK